MTVVCSALSNGLAVVSDRVDHVETVAVGLWVGVGARRESATINGAAHLIEHMLFKGTRGRSARDIAEQIEAVGGDLNAYTTREITAFHAKVLKDDIDLALEIVADMVLRSVFDPDDLIRERTVVLQEIGQALDTPDDVIYDYLQAEAFPDQALGRPVLGTGETVAGLDRAPLLDFMAREYGAPKAVLAAAGRISHDELVALAERHFGDLPARADSRAAPAAYHGGSRTLVEDLEQAHVLFGFEGVPATDDDIPAQAALSTALGGGMSSRLFQEVRERRGLAYSIFSGTSSYDDSGMFRIYAGTAPEDLNRLVPIVCEQVSAVAGTLEEAEVARAKAQLRAHYLISLESMDQRAERHATQLLRLGRLMGHDEILGRIDAVDTDAVGRVATRVFGSAPSFVALGPVDNLMPFEDIRSKLAA